MKALEQLAQQGHIREKAYGKQKVYFADQVSPGPGPRRTEGAATADAAGGLGRERASPGRRGGHPVPPLRGLGLGRRARRARGRALAPAGLRFFF